LPPVSFEHLIPKRLVLSQGQIQPWHFLMKFANDPPSATDEVFRHGTHTQRCTALWQESFSGLHF